MIDRPWTFKFELTRGCNLSCHFCPIHALPEYNADKRFLTPELARVLAQQAAELNPECRIELTMRGEPTLNPRVLECVRAMREELPRAQISMFTNGVRLLKEHSLLVQLIESGVNILNIDCYNGTYDRFQQLVLTTVKPAHCIVQTDFRSFSAYGRHPGGHAMRVVNLVPDIADPAHLVKVRVIHNNAGNVDPVVAEREFGLKPLLAPLVKQCGRPFRECAVTYDGDVVLCCHDWKAECVLGRVNGAPRQTLKSIWYGLRHRRVLRDLYASNRSGAPCNRCDYSGGFRLGLLKNPNV